MPIIVKKVRNLDGKPGVASRKDVRTITDFFNVDYRDYVHYVIANRALPSLVDGFKTGARKLMHAAFTGGMKGGNEIKQLNLIGDVYNKSLYLHGDASANGTVFTLAGEFADNLNPITISGQHGSLRDPKAQSAPRYLYCKLSKYAKLYKEDEDLLEYIFDEGQYVEPEYYLPIIPTVLCARGEGMAPGYRFSTMSYNPIDIIDACADILEHGEIRTTIRPYVRGVRQSSFGYDAEKGRWSNVGAYELDLKNDILTIRDLPYKVTFADFEKRLNAQLEKEYIRDWKNFSHDDVIDYRIQFPKSKLDREMQADRRVKTLNTFMLQCDVPEDHLWVLDEHDKVKHFQHKEDLVKYFVELRLSFYRKRKDNMIGILTKKRGDNEAVCRFIELVTGKKLVINNRPLADIRKDLDGLGLPHSVLSIPVSKLTKDEYDALQALNREYDERIAYIQSTTVERMYADDLKALRAELKDDFKETELKKNGLF